MLLNMFNSLVTATCHVKFDWLMASIVTDCGDQTGDMSVLTFRFRAYNYAIFSSYDHAAILHMS